MSRSISLCLASIFGMVGLVFPFILGKQPTGLNQSILMVLMLGIMGGFIYGAGFRAEQKWLRLLLCPAVTWPVMLLSAAVLLAIR